MEKNINIFENRRYLFENGRQPKYFFKWKTTSIVLKMEDDDLNFFENGRLPQFFFKYCYLKNSNNGCGTAPGNLVYGILVIYLEFRYRRRNL